MQQAITFWVALNEDKISNKIKGPETQNVDVFFALRLNKRLELTLETPVIWDAMVHIVTYVLWSGICIFRCHMNISVTILFNNLFILNTLTLVLIKMLTAKQSVTQRY